MKKIISWCKSHGIQYTIQDLICNCQRVEINCETWQELNIYISELYRIERRKGWTVKTHNPTKTIWIYTTADAEKLNDHNAKLQTIVNYFWELIHEGKTSREAGELQKQFAIDRGLYDVYKMYFERSATT